RATAAYEQEEEAAPSLQAMPMDLGDSSGSSLLTSDFETTASTTTDRKNPRFRPQRISQNMVNAIFRACTTGAVGFMSQISADAHAGLSIIKLRFRCPACSVQRRFRE